MMGAVPAKTRTRRGSRMGCLAQSRARAAGVLKPGAKHIGEPSVLECVEGPRGLRWSAEPFLR